MKSFILLAMAAVLSGCGNDSGVEGFPAFSVFDVTPLVAGVTVLFALAALIAGAILLVMNCHGR